jgi:glucokinase
MYCGGEIDHLVKVPATCYAGADKGSKSVQGGLVRFILQKAEDYVRTHQIACISVSIGAAINAHTGRLIASAPLWGSATLEIDLLEVLASRMPKSRWHVVNDVTALAMGLLRRNFPAGTRTVAALTVSSGIAYRIIDIETGYIPYDFEHGLQGEIGHLPADVMWQGRPLNAVCDCGVQGHVSAFSSGRGIPALIRAVTERNDLRSDQDLMHEFATAVAAGERWAINVLDLSTRPLARVLLYQATLNPQVGCTVLSGGVSELLGQSYIDSLLRNLNDLGLYLISAKDPEYFSRKFCLGGRDGLDAMRGAAVYAQGFLP